jgi:hypothetical protein
MERRARVEQFGQVRGAYGNLKSAVKKVRRGYRREGAARRIARRSHGRSRAALRRGNRTKRREGGRSRRLAAPSWGTAAASTGPGGAPCAAAGRLPRRCAPSACRPTPHRRRGDDRMNALSHRRAPRGTSSWRNARCRARADPATRGRDQSLGGAMEEAFTPGCSDAAAVQPLAEAAESGTGTRRAGTL